MTIGLGGEALHKDFGKIFRRDPHPVIKDEDCYFVVVIIFHDDFNPTGPHRVFGYCVDRVGNEIDHDLLQLVPVCLDVQRAWTLKRQ